MMLRSIARKTLSLETRVKLYQVKHRMAVHFAKLRHVKSKLRRLGLGQKTIGSLEGFEGQSVVGWAVDGANKGGQSVGLFMDGTLMAQQKAEILRNDVALAGFGDGRAGYRFDLTPELLDALSKPQGSTLEVRLLEGEQKSLGSIVTPPQILGDFNASLGKIDQLRPLLEAEVTALRDALRSYPALKAERATMQPPQFERHGRLFATDVIIPDDRDDIRKPTGLSAYIDYVHYRSRGDELHTPEPGNEDWQRVLNTYILSHRDKEKWRIPLSAQEVAFLNAPIVMPALNFDLSRAHWWRLSLAPETLKTVSNNGMTQLIYNWVMHEAPARNWDDCMVPERYIEKMRSLAVQGLRQTFPLSLFMKMAHREDKALRKLDMTAPDDRRLAYLVLALRGLLRPDLLRYLPKAPLDSLLAAENGPSILARFAGVLLRDDSLPALDSETYKELLAINTFDFDRMVFNTITAEGHRTHSAAMLAPAGEPVVDVQLVGPLLKASGLGQASRLTQKITELTGYSVNPVDFGMDNPAPEGFSNDLATSTYKRAKVNILALNAEALPMAYAFQPDVMSGAYNIAYVYWELDSPAVSHYLGMDLIDEIWVAADYGVKIYQPHMSKPVTNVGMCYEDIGAVDKTEARAFINSHFGFTGDEFVFLVAFDSFSFTQRKNPLGVLEAFTRAFADRPDVRLIVKTQNRSKVSDPVQVALWSRVDKYLANDKRIVMMNQTLSYNDLLKLKAGSDCYVSLHRSEGWGFGMIEAMNLKVPVIATGYSANLDFCPPEATWLVDYDEVELQKGDYIFIRKGQRWADPKVDHAASQMRAVYDNPALRLEKAERAYENVQQNFSALAISRRFKKRLDEIMQELDAK